jgi:CRISPR/Cas system Type II protein with McrA/HNH and RuvC-like nuclease domain
MINQFYCFKGVSKMTYDEFWIHEFKNREYATDFAGRQIKRSEQGQDSEFGWSIDHILPLSLKSPDNITNLQITHFRTNQEKADKTTFKIDDILYQVKQVKNLNQDDYIAANYSYDNKKYCIVILDEEDDEDDYYDPSNPYGFWADDD